MMTICDAALEWAARGFRVFPLQALSKLPAARGWPETATTDPATIFEFLAEGGNYGVLCRGLLVVDVDEGKHRGALAAFKALGYPPTLSVLTPSGGYHFYFRTSAAVGNSASKIAPGIDTRAGNGFVVGPGSRLPHGAYALLDDLPVAVAPDSLVAACRQVKEKTGERVVDWSAPPSPPSRVADARSYLTDPRTLVAVEGAGGDHTTFSVACALSDRGVTPAEALELMLDHWNDRCLPPWTPEDLRVKVDNAFRYSENSHGLRAADKIFEGVMVPDDAAPVSDFRMICAASFSDEKALPPREWMVPDLIPSGYVSLLYGDGGVGKSTLAMQLAYAVATGSEWLGMKVGKPGPVVFFSAEEEEGDLQEKVGFAKGPFGKFEALKNFFVVPRAGLNSVLVKFDREGELTSTPLWREFARGLARVKPSLVVLDNLADIFQGNEVDKTQARQTINTLQSICTNLGATVLVLAHPSRTGMATGDGSSGNTAWSNSARARLYLERHKTDKGVYLLSLKKANYSEPGKEFRLVRGAGSAFTKTESTNEADAREGREIADILVKAYAEASCKSMTVSEAAKAVVEHSTAKMLIQQDGGYAGVKEWLLKRLAGGVRMGDELLHLTSDGRVTLS
jgi:hypothetical protein